jgi:3-methylfumaryl-CoA hydratase
VKMSEIETGLEISGVLSRASSAALGALLGVSVPEEVLPPLWQAVHLLEMAPQHLLGPDGHPSVGIPTPPGPGRRRMFAGGRVRTLLPLRYGLECTRSIRVARRETKQGRSGLLEFVTVLHELRQSGRTAVVEEHDIVYRDAISSSAVGNAPQPAPPAVDGPSTVSMGPRWARYVEEIFLFRFSALTYNAHRIHYDRAWAEHEGYAGLVVHGPLQVLAMAELLRAEGVDLIGREFAYRLVQPMVGVQLMTACFGPEAGEVEVRDAAGAVTARGAWKDVEQPVT